MYELNEEQLKQVVGGRGGGLTVSSAPHGFTHATVYGSYNESAGSTGTRGGASFNGDGTVNLNSTASNTATAGSATGTGYTNVGAYGYLNGLSNSGANASTTYGSGTLVHL